MKIDVHWLIDGIMSVEAETPEQAEKLVAEQLTALIDETPVLTKTFGAKAIQGQALEKNDVGKDDGAIKDGGIKDGDTAGEA